MRYVKPDIEKKMSIISQKWLETHNIFQEIYDEILKGYKYLSGDQYEEKQKKWYERLRRPTRSFNIIFPVFNALIGDFILNNQRIKIYPRPGSDPRIAKLFTNILEYEDINNNVRTFFSQWAIPGLIKTGFARPYFGDEYDRYGSVIYEDVDELQVLYDVSARNPLLDDAKFMARSKLLSKEDILETVNSKQRKELRELLVNYEDNNIEPLDIDPHNQSLMDDEQFQDESNGRYRVIEWHEMKYETTEIVYDPETGHKENFTLEGRKADLFFKFNPNYKIRTSRERIKYIFTYIPAIMYPLSYKKADIQDKTYDFIPFTAYNYGPKAIYNFGIMRNARDVQDDYNSWSNMANTTMSKTLDPGHKYKEGAVLNENDIKNAGSMPGVNFIIDRNIDLNDAIRMNEITKAPFAPNEMAALRADMLQKITGFTPNLMGVQESAHENATLFVQRVKQAKTSLAIIYNNFARSKARFYEKVIRLQQENYKTEKIFPIIGEMSDTQEEVIINQQFFGKVLNDITVGEYYIIPDDLERSPSARHIRFIQKSEVINVLLGMFGDAFPMTPGMAVAIMEWWLKESDLGDIDKLLQVFKTELQQQMEQSQQTGEFQAGMEQLGGLLELAKKKKELSELPMKNKNSAQR